MADSERVKEGLGVLRLSNDDIVLYDTENPDGAWIQSSYAVELDSEWPPL